MGWYYAILEDAEFTEDFDGHIGVALFDQEYYHDTGHLQDWHVYEDLPHTLQSVLSEEMESQFLFEGSEDEFRVLMDEHEILFVPPFEDDEYKHTGWLE